MQNQVSDPHLQMQKLQEKLDYRFHRIVLLETALTHKSFCAERSSYKTSEGAKSPIQHNEKLEFLGDAVLDLVISEMLMLEFPNDEEGVLSKKRASLVNAQSLSDKAIMLGINDVIRLARSEMATGGAAKPRLLSSVLEALIGAIFIESGYEASQRVIKKIFASEVKNLSGTQWQVADYKTRFQEWVQSEYKQTPKYKIVEEQGPDHKKLFTVEVFVGEKMFGRGEGASKKSAEQAAAEASLKEYGVADVKS